MTTEQQPSEATVALVCPHCGATLHINTEWEGQPYLQVQVPEAIECYATDCGAVWEPNGTPRTAPRWEAYPDLYDAPPRAVERAARLADRVREVLDEWEQGGALHPSVLNLIDEVRDVLLSKP